MFRNCGLSLENDQVWAVSKYKRVYLRIVRNGFFRLGNVQIRAVPFCKRVDLLMFRKCFCRVRIFEI